jgi:DNA-binding LytR/AlgR family response regulator
MGQRASISAQGWAQRGNALSQSGRLRDLRILIVEDNVLLVDALSLLIEDQGGIVIGPASTVEAALVLVADSEIDGALLDIDLGGVLSFPVAHALIDHAIPIVFVTGYGETVPMPPRLRNVPRIGKPFENEEIVAAAARWSAEADEPSNADPQGGTAISASRSLTRVARGP